ncbi:MAG: peptidylprolyl isomerase [Clostridia bacterium]|nr:peptidylprolyl isomerase [Clostridia bacterium]
MRSRFLKLAALMLVLTLTLAGCNLIDVDQVEVVKDELAAAQKRMSAVVAKYDGGEITQFDAEAPYQQTASSYYSYYQLYGLSLTQDILDEVRQAVVEEQVTDRAVIKEFEKRGLTLENEDEIRAEAETAYQSVYDSYYAEAEGKTDAEKAIRTELALYNIGYTQDRLYDLEYAEHAGEVLEEAVRAEVEDLTDDELQALYEEKVAADEETYGEDPGEYGSDATNGLTTYWVPEGYRSVKHILLTADDELMTTLNSAKSALTTAQSELNDLNEELSAPEADETEEEDAESEETEEPRTAEEIQADIDAKQEEIDTLTQDVADAEAAVIASIQPTLDEIYAKLEAGDSFDDVMAEYGTDPGMQTEPGMTEGYAICADSSNMVAEFVEGSMALENVGDYSAEPVLSSYGAHIIYYAADIESGAVPFENVRDAIFDEAMEDARDEHYETERQSWVDALNPVYSLENWTAEE